MDGRLTGRDRILVPASLWVSYLANDGEELATMATTTAAAFDRLPDWVPRPAAVGSLTQGHINTSVALMGLLYAAAVVDGWRSAGRGRLYQDVQLIFGLHGFTHLGASVVTRGYTSGVITSPTVVLPQLWWARRRLRAAGVADRSHLGRGLVVVLGWLALAHAAGIVLSREEEDAHDGLA